MAESLCCTAESTQRCKAAIFQLKKKGETISAVRIVGREDRSNAHSSPEWSGDAGRPSLGVMAVADCFDPLNAVGSEPATVSHFL